MTTKQNLIPAAGIIDAHVHIASTDFIPRAFVESSAANVVAALASRGIATTPAKVVELYLSKLQDPDCAELLSEMEEARIDQAVLLLADMTFVCRSELSIEEMFQRHHRTLTRHPGKFFVFAGVDPRWGGDGVALFERGVSEMGFHGLKIYPPCGYSPSDPRLYPFYEICSARGLPVLTHTGPTAPLLDFEMGRPLLIDQAARDFPAVHFILAHGGTYHLDECLALATYRPNVHLDVSGYEALPTRRLERLFSHGADHKIIFGTDWPLFRMQGSQAALVGRLLDEGPVPELQSRQREAFFRGAIRALLGPSPIPGSPTTT